MWKPIAWVIGVASSILAQGCGHARAPRGGGEHLPDPKSFRMSTPLDGPSLAALRVALDDIMPPGAEATGNNELLVRCFNSRDLFDVLVQEANDELYVITFSPHFERCGMPSGSIVLDAGATYFINGQGRILDVR